ncbi:hypothetical protein HMPREF0201_00038 [Cedecea davisae DSM 4568]|uniref:Uncharacterized protein n=1 Tax=Cedecea davisae DSM 4568 TaxID=566551 RepID=S3JJH3_9ENTR|nr:hypothetical protein HMPREF0201_00038 [Cedecea davisae DSM 4568]
MDQARLCSFHATELRLLHDFLKSKTISILKLKIIYHIDIYMIKV